MTNKITTADLKALNEKTHRLNILHGLDQFDGRATDRAGRVWLKGSHFIQSSPKGYRLMVNLKSGANVVNSPVLGPDYFPAGALGQILDLLIKNLEQLSTLS